MSGHIAVLGAIAGATIFLGLPIGRLTVRPGLKTGLNAVATGILIFLLWDVLTHAWEPVDDALAHHEYGGAARDALVLASAFGVGLLGLVWWERRSLKQHRYRTAHGPGAAAVDELSPPYARVSGARLAVMIATGIGLHNFAEGLAIGNSAAAGELSLALLLIIGFALHNATEGFGIVAPLTGSRPSWGFLVMLGLIGGSPTFFGTLVGQHFVSQTVSIAFLGLAAGSILYVVIELLAVARNVGLKSITTRGIFIGMILGFATDAIITAAGA